MMDLLLLAAGIVVVVAGAELFFDGLLSLSVRLKTAPFVVTALISGFELENLAAGIAANSKDLAGAAAGTALSGAGSGCRAPSGQLASLTLVRIGSCVAP